jgi:ADP-dependent NAD(P)H-hydrate dehydratase
MPRSPRAEVIDAAWLSTNPLPSLEETDKDGRGTVLVVGGSPTTPGGVVLAGRAALRMGAGRLRMATAWSTATAVAVAVPEARVIGLETAPSGALLPAEHTLIRTVTANAGVVLVGPGVEADSIERVVSSLIDVADPGATMVLDAAAITRLSELPSRQRRAIEGRVILTPNKNEVAMATGTNPVDPLLELAERFGAVVTSFGRIVSPDGEEQLVPTGPAALGTSGSGDVLAGLVAGAASRTGDLALATCWATHAHIDAGLRLIGERRFGAYLASELVTAVGLGPGRI